MNVFVTKLYLLRSLPALFLLLTPTLPAASPEAPGMLSAPLKAVAGSRIAVDLYYPNPSTNGVARAFPPRLEGRLIAGGQVRTVFLELDSSQDQVTGPIPPGGFQRGHYQLDLPMTSDGQAVLEIPPLAVNPIVLTLEKPASTPAQPSPLQPETPSSPRSAPDLATLAGSSALTNQFSAVDYFKQHFFPYEPFYFIAGPDSPNAKFQISFKYRILNNDGALARHVPVLKGLHMAYTQTSIWDLSKPSAPFLDSSYKPELLYALEDVRTERWADWVHLSLQGGAQHESNGRDGLASRSLNIVYIKPTLRLGQEDGFFFSLSPRAWVYLENLSDNPDLAYYRGYADVRAILGWSTGLQLSSLLRCGNTASRGSLQLDLSYPMSRIFTRSFSFYLFAQYFTGYGESLLLYSERSSAFRVGIALFR